MQQDHNFINIFASAIAEAIAEAIVSKLPPPLPVPERKLLTTGEVAKALSVAPNTIRTFAHSGRIPFINVSVTGRFEPRFNLQAVTDALRG